MISEVKEYKFLANIYTFKRLFLVFVPVWICLPFIIFFAIRSSYLFYFLIPAVCLFVLLYFIVAGRYVKVLVDDNNIAIYYWSRLKYKAAIDQLQYVQGADVNRKYERSELKFVFNDRSFIFLLWEHTGSLHPDGTKQIRILKDLVSRYNLQKGESVRSFPAINHGYKYMNPINNPLEKQVDLYNKSER